MRVSGQKDPRVNGNNRRVSKFFVSRPIAELIFVLQRGQLKNPVSAKKKGICSILLMFIEHDEP